MTQIFEFLFKYRPLLFERGHLAFGGPWQLPLAVVALGALVVALGYRARPGQGTSGVVGPFGRPAWTRPESVHWPAMVRERSGQPSGRRSIRTWTPTRSSWRSW